MIKIISAIVLFSYLTCSCQSPNSLDDFKKMEWLLGTWKGEAAGEDFYEHWSKISDTEYSNINFSVCNGDTTVGSRSKIILFNNKIVYTSDNIIWELTLLENNKCVFENMQRKEKFTFSLDNNNNWIALLKYPTTKVEYKLSKTKPLEELLKEKGPSLEGSFEGYIEFNNKRLNTIINFNTLNGKQAAFISTPENLIFDDPVSDICYNPPHLTIKKNENGQAVTFRGTVTNNKIEGKLSGELPAKFFLSKVNNASAYKKNYKVENIKLEKTAAKLPGTLFLPLSTKPTAAVIMMFGSGSHKKEEFFGWGQMFASNGIAALIYDKRKVTDTAYPNINITRNQGSDIVLMEDLVLDAKAAFEFLKTRTEINPKKIGIWGISQGGIVAPMVISNNPRIAFSIVVSAPTTVLYECYHFQKLNRLRQRTSDENTIKKVSELWEEYDRAIINGSDLSEMKTKIDKAYAENWGQLSNISPNLPTKDDLKYNFSFNTLGLDPSLYWNKVRIPTYAVYGEADVQVPSGNSERKLREVFKNKADLLTVRTYKNSDHLIKTVPTRENFDFPRYAPGYLSEMIAWILKQTE